MSLNLQNKDLKLNIDKKNYKKENECKSERSKNLNKI